MLTAVIKIQIKICYKGYDMMLIISFLIKGLLCNVVEKKKKTEIIHEQYHMYFLVQRHALYNSVVAVRKTLLGRSLWLYAVNVAR